tara:strand:- start:6999 stop:7298 length:300 start_codon:yes stop_codon:yes gene_type:complete
MPQSPITAAITAKRLSKGYGTVETRQQKNLFLRSQSLQRPARQAIAAAYYESEVDHSNITDFSKDGNAGFISAKRYPEDFDGMVVKAPVMRTPFTSHGF